LPDALPICRTRTFGIVLALLAAQLAPPCLAAEPETRGAELSVSVRKPRQICFEDRVQVTGVLAARALAEVRPEREGQRVAQILAEPLQEVAAGQILARLARVDDEAAAGSPVRAPIAGTVVRVNAVVGLPASARLAPLFVIAAGGEIELRADVPETDLAKIKPDQAVAVTPLGLPEITAKVRVVEAATTPGTQLGRARIALAPGSDLRIGTFARGIVSVGQSCGLGVPYSAISYEAEGTIVHVVVGERVEARPVGIGLLNGVDAEILTGLSEDDDVVVRAGAFVREGDRVNAITVAEDRTR